MNDQEITRKQYFEQKINGYLLELNKLNVNAQAEKFTQNDSQEFLAEWHDILKSLDDCVKEFAKENLEK
jgi:hypothetical protein